ncbi:hypothetical protein PspS04_02985 [Pseudomonas sp. S04]|nr:hypothetical protein PspS04_02985 [Pseudomonas sp. S04]QHF31868.1 hypothetical protein PspS19_02985 [Pseudomonas sp. S19]
MSEYGHAEPKRGTEWWGKSVLLTFALFKSEPPSGGTIGGRYRRNGYVLGPGSSILVGPEVTTQAGATSHHSCVDTYALRGQAERRPARSHKVDGAETTKPPEGGFVRCSFEA